MESIVKQIEVVLRKNFAPFVADCLSRDNINVDLSLIDGYISEWLGKPAKKTPKKSKGEQKETVQQSTTTTCAKADTTSLDSMTVANLRRLCAEHGIAKSGAKADLINKLKEVMKDSGKEDDQDFKDAIDEPVEEESNPTKSHGHNISDSEPEDEPVLKASPKKSKKTVRKHKSSESEEDAQPQKRMLGKKTKTSDKKKSSKPKVVEKIERESVVLVTDEYGNSYDENTGFVFDADDQVIGKKDSKGHTLPLTKDDIELCKEMQLLYLVPFSTEEDDE